MSAERLTLATSDGLTLEARIDSPEGEPSRFTVLCHPHPLEGGSMNAPLMISITQKLRERGHAVLRFNFRGTGASTGEHEGGDGELEDVSAAMAEAAERRPGLEVGLAGWSFGAATALRWLHRAGSTAPYAGVAPPPGPLPEGELGSGPKRIIVGTRDQVIDVDALRAYAAGQGIDLVITPGDHFFHGRGGRIGSLVAQGLEG